MPTAGASTLKTKSVAEDSGRGRAARPSADSITARVREELGEAWVPRLYRERILQTRTRSHTVFPAAKGAVVEVQHTLLGIELKVGRRRQSCPDLSTARYLAVFARAGCSEVAVPYDITRISHLADELESAWQRMLLLAAHHTEGRARSFASHVRSMLAAEVRREVEEAGPGAAVPEFKQSTRQRRTPVQEG
ncbi:MAG TPA: hypothetical protein VF240_07355 [Pyrinomonadaceae bacterium]